MNKHQTVDSASANGLKSPVFVIGSGGYGKVVIQMLRELRIPIGGIFDDDPHVQVPRDVDYLGPIAFVNKYEQPQTVIAIGDNILRRSISRSTRASWLTLIHPTSYVAPSAKLGRGVVICAHAVVSEDAVIGDHTIINTSASVDHDAVVGDFSHVACGVTLAGNVSIGSDALIGAGATILPAVKIGERTVLGAGSVATRDIPSDVVAYGVPAKCVRTS